jgi:hypothetical protein
VDSVWIFESSTTVICTAPARSRVHEACAAPVAGVSRQCTDARFPPTAARVGESIHEKPCLAYEAGWRLRRFHFGGVKGKNSTRPIAMPSNLWMRECPTAGAYRPESIYSCCVRQIELDVRPGEPGLPVWVIPLVHQYGHSATRVACGRVACCQVSRCAAQPAELGRTKRASFTPLSPLRGCGSFGHGKPRFGAAALCCPTPLSLQQSKEGYETQTRAATTPQSHAAALTFDAATWAANGNAVLGSSYVSLTAPAAT